MIKGALSIILVAAITPPLVAFSASDRNLKIDEVIVTVQRKEENLVNIPISVSTLEKEEIKSIFSDGQDIRALSAHSPGLYVESSNGRIAPRFYMRGLGNVDFDLAASQPVSVVFNDVVQENVILKSFPLFDVENIEIIRGPQGTLYGRNTTAGIVKISTQKPTEVGSGYFTAGYGTNNSINLEAAVGGAISDILFGRISLLSQQQDDWIDNDYTGESEAFGGHDEKASRIQLLYQPFNSFSALFSYHQRDLDGSQTAFHANVFDTGSNRLNENYHRDSVFYDGGNDNTQKYKGNGGSLSLGWSLDSLQITSITAVEKADGSNTGDIDGGVAGIGPGFIPFSSETVDSGDVKQFTQEIRFASNNEHSPWDWQAGLFYFDSELAVTTDAGFNVATVNHENTSQAVFFHNTFRISEALSLNTGVRYTDDEKYFTSAGLSSIDLSDGQWSWDLGINYILSDTTSVYARIADGFRAPSIQGRDVAFFGQPSVADSETLLSYEAGFKADIISQSLRLNASVFYYTIDDYQVTAIGGESNSNRLMNAEKGRAAGFDLDVIVLPTENLKITVGVGYAKTEIQDSDLYTAVCGSGQCAPTDPIDINGNALVDGNPFPGSPKSTANFTLRYQIPIGLSGLIYLYSDWVYQGEINLALYESEEFVTDGQYAGGLRIGYEDLDSNYDIAIFARNITDENNVVGFVDFNNNTGFVNSPRYVGVELSINF